MNGDGDENKRLLLALGLAALIMLVWWFAFEAPAQQRAREVAEARMAEQQAAAAAAAVENPDAAALPLATPEPVSREEALAERAAIPVATPSLRGSINLVGARFDDLELLSYRQEVDQDSPPVVLFRPAAAAHGYYAEYGWLARGSRRTDMPGPRTTWRQIEGSTLSPGEPVVLLHTTEDGLTFRRTITVDDRYLFTVEDKVTNATGGPVTLDHYGRIRRMGIPPDLTNFMILHEGAVGILNNELVARKYKRLIRNQERAAQDNEIYAYEDTSPDGWLGFTDKYWLSALVAPITSGGAALAPEPTIPGEDVAPMPVGMKGQLRVVNTNSANPRFDAVTRLDPITISDQESAVVTSRLFAGAKDVEVLNRYKEDLGIPRLEMAVDWGFMQPVTKPFFYMLVTFGEWTGSFGLAILMLTIVVKAIFFPIANASYKAMAKMKAVQPKMTKLRERHKDDPQAMQKGMIELYKTEKVNPLAGCLPLIPQMFVFYALYKTLFVTIEMRHEPFFGWVRDLSERDPTHLVNLFGLLPFDPSAWGLFNVPVLGGVFAALLLIGAWPIIMGVSMWAMQTLNPPPPDPTQAKIFALMPIVFTFILAPFAVGLVIYWTWNNILTFTQQYVIMRRQGVETPIGSALAKFSAGVRSGDITPASVWSGFTGGMKRFGARLVSVARPGAKPGAKR